MVSLSQYYPYAKYKVIMVLGKEKLSVKKR